MGPTVALAHDYATQRGGAERVALMMADAFPDAPMYTTLHDAAGTYPQFGTLDLRTSGLDRVGVLRRHHRLALPFLAGAVNRTVVEADVLLASSTGWAHGYRGAGRTVVYCHAPARWLYQRARYLGPDAGSVAHRARRLVAGASLGLLSPALRRWDADAAGGADVYLANSTVTRQAVRDVYGISAEVLPPPPAMLPDGEERAIEGLAPGFLLCVARLLPYKNVDVVIEAARATGRELVVVGDGPDRARLTLLAHGAPVRLVGRVDDAQLRWVYRHASALVAASYEDYGLSPLEAASFGRPAVVLRDGGYLDTVVDGVTGVFFDRPQADDIARGIEDAATRDWDTEKLTSHAARFGVDRFAARLREVVDGLVLGAAPVTAVTRESA